MKILLIEDDEALVATLSRSLVAQHYVVDVVRDGEKGWTYCTTFEYDLLLLDIVLPKLDGINLCRRLRSKGYNMPIILLTAQNTITAKVQGLDAGADDYVVKPFDQAELLARMRALLRRSSSSPSPLMSWGELLLNPSTYEVSYNGKILALTTKEYDLLEILLRDSPYVFSSDELLDRLWSSEDFPSEATVRSHIRRVRHKLTAVGAPPDFITTLHGRGYYLKAVEAETGTGLEAAPVQSVSDSAKSGSSAVTLAISSFASSSMQTESSTSSTSDEQQQYVIFLNETWTTAKPKMLDQVAVLAQVVSDLQNNCLTTYQPTTAQQIAHKLVGSLGIFGLAKTTHLARQLEYWFGGSEPLQLKHAPLLKTLVTALQQAIHGTTQIELPPFSERAMPLLVLISSDTAFNQSLMTAATRGGLQITIMTTPTRVESVLELQPNVVLFHLPAISEPVAGMAVINRQQQLDLLQALAHSAPTLPIMVLSDQGEWYDRLAVIRRGGKLFLEMPLPPEQVMAAVVNLLAAGERPTKVMIVDGDQAWLSTLPTLLKPWGLKVTTLDEPLHFWPILQAVSPDALILEVNLPEINGFELCQMLRSAPQWQRLPVLFLSSLTDSASQNQAFTVGADDFLSKPIRGFELANRILSRLQRVRAGAL